VRILFVSSAASTHTYRWVSALVAKGIHVRLVSAEKPLFDFPCEVSHLESGAGVLGKVTSLAKSARRIREIFHDENFQILHCHYAGRYGAWGALSGVHPFVLSVWGSDILLTPKKTPIHKALVGWMLRRADFRQSTSRNMANTAKSLYGLDDFTIVPFGIDTSVFKPSEIERSGPLRLIAIKSLSANYQLDMLVRAVEMVSVNIKEINLDIGYPGVTCTIYGEGPERKRLLELIKLLRVEKVVTLMGRAPHEDIPKILSSHDVAVYPSYSESFGVSALEALACGLHVVLSDASGHVEVTEGLAEGTRSLAKARILPRNTVEELRTMIAELLINVKRTRTINVEGIAHVKKWYEWDECVAKQIDAYRRILAH
jgi:L-malate glycosyltransferase